MNNLKLRRNAHHRIDLILRSRGFLGVERRSRDAFQIGMR